EDVRSACSKAGGLLECRDARPRQKESDSGYRSQSLVDRLLKWIRRRSHSGTWQRETLRRRGPRRELSTCSAEAADSGLAHFAGPERFQGTLCGATCAPSCAPPRRRLVTLAIAPHMSSRMAKWRQAVSAI